MSFLRTLTALVLPSALAAGCSPSVTSPFSAAGNPDGYALGAPCAFDDQCVTGRCSADPATETCGECVTIEALGQDCTGSLQGCSVSAVCKGGVCTSLRKVEGETCAMEPKGGDAGECDVELYCKHGVEVFSDGTCERRIPLGESCTDDGTCVVGVTCQQGVCELPAPDGCSDGCGHSHYCGDDRVCHPGTLALGEGCGLVDGHFIHNECGPGLVCGIHTCVPAFGPGEACRYWQCAEELFCHVSTESDALSFCEAQRAEGEACSNDNVVPIPCAEGLECRGNVCHTACH